MDRLVYTSLSAMRATVSRQTAISNNLSNANTTGFRAELSSAQALWVRGQGLDTRAMPSEEVISADMKAGTLNETGRELDVAMHRDTLLAVQGPDGSEAYTRRGDLQRDQNGLLTTGDGYLVLGEGGPITLPPADRISIAGDGAIWIVPEGGDPGQPQQVDRLKLTSPRGSAVVKGTDGLFHVRGGGALPADPEASLVSGNLEGSNVDPTRALIDMIETSRSWDTQLKLISTAREIDGSAADLMRLPG